MTLQLNGIAKTYEEVEAVKPLTLTINEGELLVLVGPSGCGKTTILRMLAGMIPPDEGTIIFRQQDLTSIPPENRPTVTVFQDYALFPHITVYQNIAYGLKVRGVKKKEIEEKVHYYMKLMQIDSLKNRSINALSGGQKQRVALARAMVVDPDILLFDEPLSSLDAKLRVEMRDEIKGIQQRTGVTAVYVTHDQEEALAIADRVAVMKDGSIEQIGTPEEIYYRPTTAFVADFIGYGNFVKAKVEKKTPETLFLSMLGQTAEYPLAENQRTANSITEFEATYGETLLLFFRPEAVVPSPEGHFSGRIVQKSFLGASTRYLVDAGQQSFLKMDIFSGVQHFQPEEEIFFNLSELRIISQTPDEE